METSNYISIGALLVAILSVIYSRRAISVSERSNEISTHQQLRPLRLAVYNYMREFAQFCETYSTMRQGKPVDITRDLVARIDSFKWEIEKHGPLQMPEVEKKASEFQNKAWQLQRLLDRIAGGQNQPLDKTFDTAEDNKFGLVEWFHNEGRNLRTLFEPYLSGA